MAITDFDKVADIYDKNLENLLSKYVKGTTEKYAEYKIQLAYILLREKNIKSILDFGCGTGRSLNYLSKYFQKSKLSGCDVSGEELEIAKRILPNAFFFNNTNIEEFAQSKEKYDLIFTACVIHHIDPKDRKKWVDAVLKRLSNNGYWVIFEHNLFNPYTKRIVTDKDNKVDNVNWMLSREKLLGLFKGRDDVSLYWQGYTLFSPIRFTPSYQENRKGKISFLITNFERLLKWCSFGAQQCVVIKKDMEKL